MVRQHEEFIWLHDRFEENESYAGYIVRADVFFPFVFVSFHFWVWFFVAVGPDTAAAATARL